MDFLLRASIFLIALGIYSIPATTAEDDVNASHSYIHRLKDIYTNGTPLSFHFPCTLYISLSNETAAKLYEKRVRISDERGKIAELSTAPQYDPTTKQKLGVLSNSYNFTILNDNPNAPDYESDAVFYFVYEAQGEENAVFDAIKGTELINVKPPVNVAKFITVLSAYKSIALSKCGPNTNVYAGGIWEAHYDEFQLISVPSNVSSTPSYILLEPCVTLKHTFDGKSFSFGASISSGNSSSTKTAKFGWGETTLFTSPYALLEEYSRSVSNASYSLFPGVDSVFTVAITGDLHYQSKIRFETNSCIDKCKVLTLHNTKLARTEYTFYGKELLITYTRDEWDETGGLFATVTATKTSCRMLWAFFVALPLIRTLLL